MNLTTLQARQVLQAVGAGDDEAALAGLDLDGVVVVQVEGDIDLYSGPRLRQVLKELLPRVPWQSLPGGGRGLEPHDRVEVSAVVVDLTDVDFMDSFAVGVLVHGHRLARPGGRAYALVATNPLIHTLFDVTGLSRVLPLHRDLATALRKLHPANLDTSLS